MFRNVVNSTEMTSTAANNYFRINGQSYDDDVSFLSTLRALVSPRMPENETISLCFTRSSYKASDVASNSANRMVKAICEINYYDPGTIMIHNMCSSKQEDNYACLELMKSTFCDVFPGFEPIEKVTDFFRKTFYSLCFVNRELKQVVIFVDSLNMRKMHYLQCAIFAFLPWYFNPEDGVTSDEMALIQSLREKSPDNYLSCISKIAQAYDFRAMNIRRLLKGFEVRFDEKAKRDTEQKLRNLCENIDDYHQRIADCLRKKNDLDLKLLGLIDRIAKGGEESEIMDYFLCNQRLVLYNVNNNEMRFAVKDYLTYFDEDMAKRIINNKSSFVYDPGFDASRYISKDNMEKLMNAIFVDQTLKLRVCAAYKFVLGSEVQGLSGYDFGHECETYLPNAHIDRYRCLGNYERAINQYIKNGDYVGAIEQCIASCKSLNFADSTVMYEFMKRLYGYNGYRHNRCIELPDGSVVEPDDAVKWLNSQLETGMEETNEQIN